MRVRGRPRYAPSSFRRRTPRSQHMRELETPEERQGASREAADHWSGSNRVVQVRPHVWSWLAPRVGAGAVLEIGPGLRPTAPVGTSTFVDASGHAIRRLRAAGGTAQLALGSLPFPDA